MSDALPPPQPGDPWAGRGHGQAGSPWDAPPIGPSAEDVQRRRIAIGAAVVCIAALAGVAAFTFLRGSDRYPDDWDPRVRELVAFVEEDRELEFDHPVHIDFLSPSEYSEVTRTDETDLTDEDRESFEEAASMLRSLGLISGEVDLFSSVNELYDSGTLAYYDHLTDRIVVRGERMTVDLQVTLVHELVHAAQDQHFDLSRLDLLESSGEATALRAVVEGDATLVEERYITQLRGRELDEYESTVAGRFEGEETGIPGIPEILLAQMGAPYALGAPLVGIVQLDGGWSAVDELLRDPPTTELELLDASAYLNGFDPVEVDPIELPDGHELVDEGDFGAVTLFMLLATRMPPIDALAVADTWAGDAYLSSTDADDRSCTQVATAAAGGDAADRLEAALGAWATAAPAESDARIDRDGLVVTFTSCDPGSAAESEVLTDPLTAISVPTTRSYLLLGALESGSSAEEGACVADLVISRVSVELLSDPDPDEDELNHFYEVMRRSMATCA